LVAAEAAYRLAGPDRDWNETVVPNNLHILAVAAERENLVHGVNELLRAL
jgi:hypothetical protein